MSDCHPADAPCDPDWKCRTHLGAGAEVAASEALARLKRVEALAAEYEHDAKGEPRGGELWSTTAKALRAALTSGSPR